MTPTVAAPAGIESAERPYLAAPRVAGNTGPEVPVATWSKRDLRAVVTEGTVTSTWSGSVVFRDGRPGGHVGYELVDVECEDATGEVTMAARLAATELLDGYADEIGEAR